MAMDIDFMMANTRFYPISLFGLKIARYKKIRTMVLEHGSAYLTLNNPILDMVLNAYEHAITFLVKCFHPRFYTVSSKSGAWLKTFGINCSGTLSNAVDSVALHASSSGRDFRSELEMRDNDLLVVYTGRMLLGKGIDPLARAVEEINQGTEDKVVCLAFAGDGPALPSVEPFTSREIHVLGRLGREGLAALLDCSDVLCLPTNSEGFPTSALEAGAFGLGVVITNTGGTQELIPDENYGIVIPDVSVEAVKGALLRFAEDEEYLQSASSNIKKRTEALFNWGTWPRS